MQMILRIVFILIAIFIIFNEGRSQSSLSQKKIAKLYHNGRVLSKSELDVSEKEFLLSEYKTLLAETAKYQNESDIRIVQFKIDDLSKVGLYMVLLPQHHIRQPILYFLKTQEEIKIIRDFSKREFEQYLLPFIEKYGDKFKSREIKKMKSYFNKKN